MMRTADTARSRPWLRTGILLCWIAATSLAAAAQHQPPSTPQTPASPPAPDPSTPLDQQNGLPPGMATSEAAKKPESEIWAEEQAKVEARRRGFIREHYRHLRQDVDKLLDLATELKAYGAGSGNAVTSAEMIKKVHKIEDLSHDLRKVMYSQEVPHIKKSGTGLFDKSPNSAAPSTNETAPELQRAAGLCLDLATHLKESTYRYLEQTNLNTVSVASKQRGGAYDIVNTAAQLEGLAYELRNTGLRGSPQM